MTGYCIDAGRMASFFSPLDFTLSRFGGNFFVHIV
jgi:hypothetical protein